MHHFREEVVSLLSQNNQRVIIKLAQWNRIDLFNIIYNHTSDLLFHTSILDAASMFGNLHLVQFLFQKHASYSNAALSNAARNGHLQVVVYLVENCRDLSLSIARDHARSHGKHQVVEYLDEAIHNQ